LLALALAGSGCSFSYQLDNMLAKKDEGRADSTGTLRLAVPKPAAETPAEGDLAIARAAASEVLTKGGTHTSLPWENPKTGARGTVTPLASTYQQDGITCRDFSRQLREERQRVVVAGRGLPRRARQVASAQFAPSEQHLVSRVVLRPSPRS
jgi:17 kDa outer membrane surface antigen